MPPSLMYRQKSSKYALSKKWYFTTRLIADENGKHWPYAASFPIIISL
jgi:hypothetical protein